MHDLQELIRRIKEKAADDLVYHGQAQDTWEDENNGAIAFCRELCGELELDADIIRQSILKDSL